MPHAESTSTELDVEHRISQWERHAEADGLSRTRVGFFDGAPAADLIARWPHRADLITALTR